MDHLNPRPRHPYPRTFFLSPAPITLRLCKKKSLLLRVLPLSLSLIPNPGSVEHDLG